MADFTAAELKMIRDGLVLLREKGPGWPIRSADEFVQKRAEVSVLHLKVQDMIGGLPPKQVRPVVTDTCKVTPQDRMLKAMRFRG